MDKVNNNKIEFKKYKQNCELTFKNNKYKEIISILYKEIDKLNIVNYKLNTKDEILIEMLKNEKKKKIQINDNLKIENRLLENKRKEWRTKAIGFKYKIDELDNTIDKLEYKNKILIQIFKNKRKRENQNNENNETNQKIIKLIKNNENNETNETNQK